MRRLTTAGRSIFDLTSAELGTEAQPGKSLYGIEASNDGKLIVFGGGIPLKDGDEVSGVSGGTVGNFPSSMRSICCTFQPRSAPGIACGSRPEGGGTRWPKTTVRASRTTSSTKARGGEKTGGGSKTQKQKAGRKGGSKLS